MSKRVSACGCAKSTSCGAVATSAWRCACDWTSTSPDSTHARTSGHDMNRSFSRFRRWRRHPVRRHEQYRAGLERAQQRQRDRPETLARIVEREQHGARRARRPPLRAARYSSSDRRAIAVAVQEFEIAREYLRLHVVIREDRNFAARHRQAEDEAGVAGSRDAGRGAQQPTDVVHGAGILGGGVHEGRPRNSHTSAKFRVQRAQATGPRAELSRAYRFTRLHLLFQ